MKFYACREIPKMNATQIGKTKPILIQIPQTKPNIIKIPQKPKNQFYQNSLVLKKYQQQFRWSGGGGRSYGWWKWLTCWSTTNFYLYPCRLCLTLFFFFFDNFDLKLRRETTVGGGGDELRRLRHGGLRQRDSSDPRIRERFQG